MSGKGEGAVAFHRSTELHNLNCPSVLKPVLHLILEKCLTCARTSEYDDPRKVHALQTFSVASRCILAKNLEGWEVMTVFAGEVEQSDKFFMVGGAPLFHRVVRLTCGRLNRN